MDQLTDECSFVLCDSKARGFPILHASMGFENLFGYEKEESVGMNCGELIGSQCILSNRQQALLNAAAEADLDAATALRGIERLKEQAAQVVHKAHSEQEEIAGPVLLINSKKNGELIVCEMSLQFTHHPSLHWPYAVAVQRDVSKQLSVPALLKAAAVDDVDVSAVYGSQMLAKEHWKTAECLRQPKTVEHVQRTTGLIWQDILSRDMLEKKNGAARKRGAARSLAGQSLASVSTACTLSEGRAGAGVGTASRQPATFLTKHVSVKQEASAPFHHFGAFVQGIPRSSGRERKDRFIDLLELWSSSSYSSDEAAADETSDFGEDLENSSLEINEELYHLNFPLIIADPSQEHLPVVLCSRGFTVLQDCQAPLGCSLCSLLQRSPCPAAGEEQELEHFLRAAREERFFEGAAASGRHAGELLMRSSILDEQSRPIHCAVLLKQFLIDDKMFVLALLERLSCEAEDESLAKTLRKLNENIATATGAMASRHFLSAPFQRQQA